MRRRAWEGDRIRAIGVLANHLHNAFPSPRRAGERGELRQEPAVIDSSLRDRARIDAIAAMLKQLESSYRLLISTQCRLAHQPPGPAEDSRTANAYVLAGVLNIHQQVYCQVDDRPHGQKRRHLLGIRTRRLDKH